MYFHFQIRLVFLSVPGVIELLGWKSNSVLNNSIIIKIIIIIIIKKMIRVVNVPFSLITECRKVIIVGDSLDQL